MAFRGIQCLDKPSNIILLILCNLRSRNIIYPSGGWFGLLVLLVKSLAQSMDVLRAGRRLETLPVVRFRSFKTPRFVFGKLLEIIMTRKNKNKQIEYEF